MITIREVAFSDLDPAEVVALFHRVQPDFALTAEEFRSWESARPARLRSWWIAATVQDRLLGLGSIAQPMYSDREDTCVLRIHVDPDLRRRGTGRALHDMLMSRAAVLDPAEVIVNVLGDQREALGFLERRGYAIVLRSPKVKLDLAGFDTNDWDAARGRVDAAGFERIDFARWIARRGDETAHRELHALEADITGDVPHPDGHPIVLPGYDEWRTMLSAFPGFRPDGYRLAVAPDGTLAGVSMVWPGQSGGVAETGFTGVRRSWRRRGVAIALKADAAEWARSIGATALRTENAEENAGMRAINAALGFAEIPPVLTLRKHLRDPR